MVIRPATVADAEGLGLVHVRTWQAAYRGQVPQEHLDAMDPVARAAKWVDILRASEPPAGTSVAVHEVDGIIGFTSVGPATDDDAGPGQGAVYAIYVAAAQWGRGVGRQLMDDAVGRLRTAGFTWATLWVLESNAQARRFYERAGWRPDGHTLIDESRGFPLHEVRYRRPLT